eukprot:172751-Pelagomonas_calceolata.AAC.4
MELTQPKQMERPSERVANSSSTGVPVHTYIHWLWTQWQDAWREHAKVHTVANAHIWHTHTVTDVHIFLPKPFVLEASMPTRLVQNNAQQECIIMHVCSPSVL